MPRPCSIRPIRDSRATEPVFRPASHTTLNRLVCPYYIALSLIFQPPMAPTFQHSKDAELTTTLPVPWNRYLERSTLRPSLPNRASRATVPTYTATQLCSCSCRGKLLREKVPVHSEWVAGEPAFEILAFPSYPTKVWLCLVSILAVSPHALCVCRKGVFVGLHPRAFVYFYICILHSNRDFMHRIKRFPPISLGLSFC